MPFIPTKTTMETMIKNSVVSDVSVDFIISDAIYHTIEFPIDSLTIRENILGPCKDQSIISEMEKNLDSIGVLSELKQLPIGLNTLCTNEIMNNLSEEAKFSICNVFTLFVKTHMVVLNAKKFFQLASDFQKHFLSQMPDKFVILLNTEVTEFDHSILGRLYKSSFFAVTDAECIVGFGDYQWFKSQQEDIKVFLRERLSEKDKENQYRGNLFDDDSDFDDDI